MEVAERTLDAGRLKCAFGGGGWATCVGGGRGVCGGGSGFYASSGSFGNPPLHSCGPTRSPWGSAHYSVGLWFPLSRLEYIGLYLG